MLGNLLCSVHENTLPAPQTADAQPVCRDALPECTDATAECTDALLFLRTRKTKKLFTGSTGTVCEQCVISRPHHLRRTMSMPSTATLSRPSRSDDSRYIENIRLLSSCTESVTALMSSVSLAAYTAVCVAVESFL